MVSRSAADLVTLLVVAAVIAATTACAARPEEKLELVIGANLELSGQDAQLGQAHRNAMQLMVEQHDADRDVDIIVVYRDNRGSPENARRITQNMLTDDGIDAIVGGATASTAAALGAAAGTGPGLRAGRPGWESKRLRHQCRPRCDCRRYAVAATPAG
jgi:ABC-type branched-subunit amino acid transport system substrate-binding protein